MLVVKRFRKAFYEDKLLATKWLFFAGDVRGGMGERRLFRLCMNFLAETEPELAKALLPLIAEYTRWDNLVALIDTGLSDEIARLIKAQLDADIQSKANGKPISLLAKWLPSVNATSERTRALAKSVTAKLGMTAKQYRQTVSELRKYLSVVEVTISAKNWSEVKYENVPSKANLLYKQAFLRNDANRRNEYLEALKSGGAKIHADVLFPHDVVHKYCSSVDSGFYYGYRNLDPYDETVEQLWKALPNYVQGDGSTLCVADGSGSMLTNVGGGSCVSALEVANALAIYFAERCEGRFKDTYITFSENPQIVSLKRCKSLHGKLNKALAYNEVANTNIEAVFDLILTTAVKHKMPQENLPRNILILSDMEFDDCAVCNDYEETGDKLFKKGNRLFEEISARYQAHGYMLPRLIFWNICSRTLTVPLKYNKQGVVLVSGFSPTVLNMVLSGELNPYKCLVEQLSLPRYDAVETAVKNIISD